jgi:hypothetical protein
MAGVLLAWLSVVGAPVPGTVAYAATEACGSAVDGHGGDGALVIAGEASCNAGNSSSPSSGKGGPVPVVKTVDCGPPQVSDQLRPTGTTFCRYLGNTCSVPSAAQLPTDPHATTTVTIRQNPDGTWTQTAYSCAARSTTPQLTAQLLRQQIQKRVPHPGIGVAPPGGITLVHIQTLLWLNTPPSQPLGTATLLGHHLTLRVHVHHVDWDFGDGSSDTTTGPQRRYDPTDPCHTPTCPRYWGHTYTHTGTTTLHAHTTWTGQYRIDGGGWLTIPGTVTGPDTTTTLTIRQARGILVSGSDH